MSWTTAGDRSPESCLLIGPQITNPAVPFVTPLDKSSGISIDAVPLKGQLIGFAYDCLVEGLRRRRPFSVAGQPIFDFPGFHGICRPTAQFADDEFHAVCKCIQVPLGVIPVPLDCLASQLPHADRSLTKIVGQFHTNPLISLSLLVERDGIGTPTDLLLFRLALDFVSNPPDATPLLSLLNPTHLGWSFFSSHMKPSASSAAKPTPEPTLAILGFSTCCKLLILW